eukprot:m.428233 g.428233  ORF g.428233 m.428233 type:complete len:76 (-) comp21374_c0_seq2:1617-1844(-)
MAMHSPCVHCALAFAIKKAPHQGTLLQCMGVMFGLLHHVCTLRYFWHLHCHVGSVALFARFQGVDGRTVSYGGVY